MKIIKHITALGLLLPTVALAQDLEPRRWTPIPLDLQVVGAGYGYSSGDIIFDPVLKAEDVEVDMHLYAASYVTSFKLLDKLARFDVVAPYASGEWEGLLESVPTKLERSGWLDPVFRVSVNLMGSPALNTKQLMQSLGQKKSNTIVGVALSVRAPLGEYFDDKLINLGENRFTIRPQLGLVHTRDNWSYELTGSIFYFTDNDDFFGNKKREQQPLYAIQSHVIYSFVGRKWLSVSAGYGLGGQSKVNGVNKDDKRHTLLSAVSFGMPITQTQSVKVVYINQKSNASTGVDADSLALAWNMRF